MTRQTVTIMVCDGCKTQDVPMTAWKVGKGSAKARTLDLCAKCEQPLAKLVAGKPAPRGRKPLPVATMEQIEAAKKPVAKKAPSKRVRAPR